MNLPAQLSPADHPHLRARCFRLWQTSYADNCCFGQCCCDAPYTGALFLPASTYLHHWNYSCYCPVPADILCWHCQLPPPSPSFHPSYLFQSPSFLSSSLGHLLSWLIWTVPHIPPFLSDFDWSVIRLKCDHGIEYILDNLLIYKSFYIFKTFY